MSTISDAGNRQNLEGFKYLRRRYVRRAGVVARDEHYRRDIVERRRSWNLKYSEYRIVPVATLEELESSPLIVLQDEPVAGYIPAALAADRTERWDQESVRQASAVDWVTIVLDLCDEYWPARWYGEDAADLSSPVSRFVTACLFSGSTFEVGYEADQFIPEIRLQPQAFHHRPTYQDPLNLVRLQGQVNFLLDYIEKLLDDRNELGRLLSIKFDMVLAGHKHLIETGIPAVGPGLHHDWWYLPILPGISTSDVENATSEIVELSRDLFGQRRLDSVIHELRREDPKQWTYQAIADALGVTIDTVRTALRASESPTVISPPKTPPWKTPGAGH